MNSSPRLARRALTTAALAGTAVAAAALICFAVLAPASGVSSGASGAPARAVAASGAGTDTFLAEGQDIAGTALHEPACLSGCVLSGDATSILDSMTWSRWTGTAATGAGTERIESCMPNCASGGQYRVAVVVTFSHPVKDCLSRTGPARAGTGRTARRGARWFWSRASFSYPHGLPSALRGASAPSNPWIFTSVIDQARASCR